MKSLRFSWNTHTLAGILCFLAALTLQTQVTLFASEAYLGLRINLTDILAPLAGLAILYTLVRRQSVWPAWTMPHMYLWLGALCLLMTFGLLRTYFLYGEISPWAAVNKYLGWYILVAIMGMGGWIATNATHNQIALFIRTLIYVALAILLYQCAVVTLQSFTVLEPYIGLYKYTNSPMSGLMKNRNAYALLTLAILAISTCFYFSRENIISEKITYLIYFLLPIFMIFNFSRAGLVALSITLSLLFIKNLIQPKKILKLVLFFLGGLIFLSSCYYNKSYNIFFFNHNPAQFITKENTQDINYPGDLMRITILKDSTEMLRENTVLGSGLGSALLYQAQKHGKAINVIDSTPVWMLVELGALGLGMFVLFYMQVIKGMWLRLKTDDDFSRTIRTSILLSILGFSIMCMFHEITYTRHMWFLIGLGLALPSRMRQDV